MTFHLSLPLHISILPQRLPSSLSPSPLISHRLLNRTPRKSLHVVSSSSPKSLPSTEQEVIEAVVNSDEKSLPCVRSYENDLCRLTLVGAVDFEQALTAGAADGGEAAAEHIDSGMPAMVVETIYPGSSGEYSTVSTRLFLPARKVKEKAKKLRNYFTEDMLSSSTSRNILAMTFRQVVLQQLWSFDLMLFRPGSERNMNDLENPREVSVSFTISSSDKRVISVLAEVMCLSALENTENNFLKHTFGKTTNGYFHFFHKPNRIISKDSSIIISKLFEDEIVQNANTLLETYKSAKANFKPIARKSNFEWWTSLVFSELEKIGGPEFSTWAREYIPAYKLQIDDRKLKDLKLEGWKESTEHVWEILLTHSQMVELANIIDMYYEDQYTIPDKQLYCGKVANFTYLSKNKRNSSLLKILSVSLASGIFLLTVSVLGQLSLPYLYKGRKYTINHNSTPSSAIDYIQHQSLEPSKMENFCISIVNKVKESLGWSGDTISNPSVGTWTGELPIYLRRILEATIINESNSTSATPSVDGTTSVQEIASYQVVLSMDGKIVGFQPTSQVAVNSWATNPLATELYGGKKLSPGLLEPGLKIQQPNKVIIIELLMSTNPLNFFALARPIQGPF